MKTPAQSTKGVSACAGVILVVLAAASMDAQQQLTLQFRDTGVTLDARNVPVQQILAEWARLGGTRIVNGEKVAGPPVTLQLVDVSEREALDVVLRSVSGYMLAMRQSGIPGASAVDRILILPTSTAPRNPPSSPAPTPRAAVPNRPTPPTPGPQPFDGSMQTPDDQSIEPVITAGVSTEGAESVPIAADVVTPPAAPAPGPARRVPGSFVSTPAGPFGSTPTPSVIGARPPSPGQPASVPPTPFGVPRGTARPGIVMPPVNQTSPFTPGATLPPQQDGSTSDQGGSPQ